MAKQFKKGQISATRAYEIADSLMKNANSTKRFALQQKSIGESAVKNKVGDKKIPVSDPRDVTTWGNTLSGKDRIKLAQKLINQSKTDSTKSVLIKKAADKAIGRDIPLPSSDKLF